MKRPLRIMSGMCALHDLLQDLDIPHYVKFSKKAGGQETSTISILCSTISPSLKHILTSTFSDSYDPAVISLRAVNFCPFCLEFFIQGVTHDCVASTLSRNPRQRQPRNQSRRQSRASSRNQSRTTSPEREVAEDEDEAIAGTPSFGNISLGVP